MILKSVNLTKAFGKMKAVDNISLDFKQQELTAIIGPNGAGKSTFFNLISGRFKPTSGEVYFNGQKISGMPPYAIIRKGISRSFQISNIFRGLTAFENIRIGILANLDKGKDFVTQIRKMHEINELALKDLETIGLGKEKNEIAGTLSYGDQRRLEIGITLTCNPNLMLLDEPTAGMNAEETKMLTVLIKDIAEKKGVTVIFTEHDMNVVFDISKRIIVLQQGVVIADGNCSEIRANKRVREAYLGVEL